MMAFRWGILGLGGIAHAFADGLKSTPNAKLVAVGSRTQEKADTFGGKFDVPRRYGSYQALVDDPGIDAIYVATPHPMHYANSLLAINGGKAVICEKAFTVNADECSKLIAAAKSKNVFLMEAMWSRFTPVMGKIRELIKDGAIGEVRQVHADFGFRADFDPTTRFFDPVLGGGGLLDVGVYTISFASMILGKPSETVSLAELGKTGTDDQSAMIFKYPKGELAVLSCAVRTTTGHVASIFGTEGRISLDAPWYVPKKCTLYCNGKEPEVIAPEFVGNGYNYEAAELQRCVQAGKLESDILKLTESLSIMQTMDGLRAQWGLKYPSEKQ
jgi:predicted dehydrogenase